MHIPTTSNVRRFAVAALSTTVALTLAGCASAGASAASLTADNHIHNLIPSDDGQSLLVGSHKGLFTVDLDSGDVAGPVGENVVDLMGLAPTDDGLIASGHPGPSTQDLQGPSVGLITSADAGETWEAVSLEGVADFHALTYDRASGTMTGAYGERLLISDDDGATWREGAAAAPYNLLATTSGLMMTSADGLSVSTDAGESFQPVEGAPPLVLLASDGDTVIGVDLDGSIWLRDAGGQWTAQGATPEQAHALALTPGGEAIVATAAGLQRTSDLGQTWQPLGS